MQKTQPNTSGESIQDLRQRVLQGLPCRAAVLVDLIDALSVGPRPATPSEVGLSPLWGYANSTLYSGLREGATPATVAALRDHVVGAVGRRAARRRGRRGAVAGESIGRDQL